MPCTLRVLSVVLLPIITGLRYRIVTELLPQSAETAIPVVSWICRSNLLLSPKTPGP